MLKNRETEAREVLRKFVSSNDVEGIEEEIADIKESLNEHMNPNCIQELRLLMKWKNLKRYVCCSMYMHGIVSGVSCYVIWICMTLCLIFVHPQHFRRFPVLSSSY